MLSSIVTPPTRIVIPTASIRTRKRSTGGRRIFVKCPRFTSLRSNKQTKEGVAMKLLTEQANVTWEYNSCTEFCGIVWNKNFTNDVTTTNM